MIIKRLLLAPLILLLGWIGVSFVVAQRHVEAHKINQLTLGTIGEPDDLNPIISQSTIASEVEAFIFNGLLKRDEDLDIVGDLARDYQITQDSVGFFNSPDQARQALAALEASRQTWSDMKLASCRVDDARLILQFSDPKEKIVAGTSYEEHFFKLVDRQSIRPVAVITLPFSPTEKLADGTQATFEAVAERLKALAQSIDGADIHEISAISDSMLSVTVIGAFQQFSDAISGILKGSKEEPVGEVLEMVDQMLLNEPVITFKLRDDVRWQDKQPFTSADVAFTYRSIIDPQYRSPRASDWWPVKDVQTPDDHTFVVRYRVPYGECLSSWQMSILPRHILEGKSAKWWADNYNASPIGTGPFRLAEWRRNELIRLEANCDYFEGKPNLPAVAFRVLPDPFVHQIAFDARGFDTTSLAPFQVKRYEDDTETFRTFRRWGLGYLYIGWNLRKPVFADKTVRLALAHAVDVDRIIKAVYKGYARKANGTFPFQMWYANKDIQPFPYDPDKARQMLAQAGWSDTDGDGWLDKDGKRFEFNLITNQGNTMRASIQALVQDDLKKVGIKVNTAVYEWAVFLKNYINTQEFDACVLGWYVGYSYDQFQLWHSSQAQPPGMNHCSYKSAKADDLLKKIRTTFDRQEIIRLVNELQKVIYEDQPYLFLCFNEVTSALYKNMYVVRRPVGTDWVVEPIRDTKAGYTYYMQWWAPQSVAPHLAE